MISKSITDRIGKILNSLQKAADGDYSTKLDFASQDDELGLIADAVNTLLQKTDERLVSARQTSTTLTEDARRYRHIIDNIEESYFEVDLQGNLLFFNDTVIRDLGYSPEKLRGINFNQLMDEANVKKVYEAFHQVFLTGQPIKGFDWEILKKNKEKIDVESSVALLRDETGRPAGFRGIVRDISQRVQFQKDLRQSEEKYRTILDIMDEGYFEQDLKGRISFVNDATCRLMGYQREELIGMHYRDYLTPAVAQKMKDLARGVYLTGKPARLVDYDLVRSNGSVITYEINVALRYDPSGPPCGFRVLIRDLSLRKKAEEERRLSEEKYRTILEIMEEGYFESDLRGAITFVNDAGCNLAGYPREELIGAIYNHYSSPETTKRLYDICLSLYKSGIPDCMLDYGVILKDGSIRFHQQNIALMRDVSGRPKGFRALVRDVTERKKAEDALRESEEKYRNILENMQETYLETDLKGNLVFFNDSLCRVFGYSREELQNMNYRVVNPLGLQQHIFEDFNEIYRTGKTKTFMDHAVKVKDGSIRITEMSMALLRSPAGEPIGFAGIGRDVTERVKTRRKIEESERHLRLITDNIRDIIWTMDFDLRWTYLSPSIRRMTGFTPEEVMKIPLKTMLPPETYAMIKRTLSDALSKEASGSVPGEQKTTTFELPFMHKNGAHFWVEISAVFSRDENGKPLEIVGVTRDISERKKAEEDLRESEKRYRMIVENVHDVIMIADFNFNLLYISNPNNQITGYTIEEIKQLPAEKLLTPESLELAVKAFIEETEKDKTLPDNRDIYRTLELEILHKNGGTAWMEINATFNRDEHGRATELLLAGRNITERKKIELALEESDKLYRMIVENMHDSIAVLDLNFGYIYISPSEIKITGYEPEEIVKIPLKDQMTPESYRLVEQIFAEELERECSGQPIDLDRSRTMELEVYHKNGGTIWEELTTTFTRDENGKPVGLMVTTRNITEQRKAKEDLKKSEKRYRMIIENMHEIIWTTDLSMEYTYVSPSCLRVVGYTSEEIVNIPLDQFLTPDSLTLAQNTLTEELTREFSGEIFDPYHSKTVEQEFYHKNGGTVWLDVTSTFTRDENGKPIGILMAGRDITARKKAEEEKGKLEAQLLQAHKMEVVGRLAGGVAHDFNNMLSVILGYVDLAKMRLARQHPVLTDIAEIEKAAIRSRDITTQLLAFSRKQIIEPKVIDLNEMVSHTQKALIRLIGEDIELKVLLGDNLWPILFDPSQIEQILINLAVNARDAIQGGGKLTVETANITLDDFYCENHAGFKPGYYVHLSFSDNGMGMDKEILKHIFEPFYTTKEVGKGTGLGLATVYGIVKQNNGFINVYSEPEYGTTFSVYLPRAFGKRDIQDEYDEEPGFAGHGNVLLVEDDAMVLQITKGMLEIIGYTVISTNNPPEALSICKNNDTSIDVVITDVVMPVMSGKELRNKLVEIRPGLKIIFMSGYTADVIAHHGILEEGVLFLQKPFTIKDLACKVSEALA